MGGWVEDRGRGLRAPLDDWQPPPKWGVGAHAKHLRNLYVYFWRWAAWKVFGGDPYRSGTDKSEAKWTERRGVVCFITVAGFLNGPGFQKMRADLRREADEIYVVDCTPEGHQPPIGSRIFQAVQQPVCIVLALRRSAQKSENPATVRFRSLSEGSRALKFQELAGLTIDDEAWVEAPAEWRAPFLPAGAAAWVSYPALEDLFTYNGSGVMTGRTWAIAPDAESLRRRWERLRDELGACPRNGGFWWRRLRELDFCLLMSKTFRPWTIDQPLLLPPSVQDFVGEDHLARFILALVLEHLDLGEIEAAYASERGQPPFDPAMMTALLLYGYCHGVYSSRRIAKATRERVDFMSIVGLDPPDFRTVSDFRKRHLKALAGLFGQVLKLCEQAGFVKLGHVALDGTKIKANASKHKAMSYERMEKRAAELEAEVERWLSAAEAADAEEDRAFGRDKSGAELPKWVADKKKRAEKIRAAKAELEAEAKAAAAAKAKAQAEAEERRQAEGRKKPGKPAAPPSEEPDPKAQKNFTDPESRIMKTKDGFIQGYNAQAAVDATAQVIVAYGLDAKQSDQHQLAPIADAIEANLGKKPTQLSADAGYCSDANLAAMEEREIDAYIAPGRAKHAGEGEGGGARVAAMRERIKAGGRSSPYRLRKQLPEPVFGQIKQARGFRQFLLRGVEKVANEWGLVCLAHNILKLAQGRTSSLAALAMG